MTEREKSYAEMLYQPNDPELAADRDVTVKKLHAYNNMDPLDRTGRQEAIRGILGKAGENCVVEQPFFCTYGYNTTVGDHFFLNVNGKLMDSGKITIGNNVFLAPNVSIITEEHAMDAKAGSARFKAGASPSFLSLYSKLRLCYNKNSNPVRKRKAVAVWKRENGAVKSPPTASSRWARF